MYTAGLGSILWELNASSPEIEGLCIISTEVLVIVPLKGLMAGCTTYVAKPFVHDEFDKMLERIMRWVREFNDGK